VRFKAARITLLQPEWKEGRKKERKEKENREERKKIQEELSGI